VAGFESFIGRYIAALPATGSLLVPLRHSYAARVRFVNVEHVIVVWLGNQFEAEADLTRSAGFWMTYSATDDVYLQRRSASHWSGGAQWLTRVPSTHGRFGDQVLQLPPVGLEVAGRVGRARAHLCVRPG
jgi:hypothetical protein